jgi:hypothetical protein
MICGCRPETKNGRIPELNQLCVHEIANGSHRQKAQDKPYACLVVCWGCNAALNDKARWPVARQLAVLKKRSPDDFDLPAFNYLVNPRAPDRVTMAEVDRWEIEEPYSGEPERERL